MADDTQAVADAPEQAAEAAPEQDSPESTKPTPVREAVGAPERPGQVKRQAKDDLIRELAGGDEPPDEPEEAEETAETDETAEPEPIPEVSAEEAVSREDGPAEDILPEGWQYDDNGRLHDEQGRYVSPMELTEDETRASGEDAASPSDDPDAPSVPEGYDTIPLPDGHPLRDRGEDALPVPSLEELQETFGEERGQHYHNYFRHLVNAGAENRQLGRQLSELQSKMARLEAEREVAESDEGREWDPRSNPELRQEIEEIRRAYGDERAEQYIEALKAKRKEMVEERANEALSEHQQQQVAHRFVQHVNARAPQAFTVWAESGELGQRLTPLLQEYAKLVDAGVRDRNGRPYQPHPDQFEEWAFWEYYAHDPRVQQRARQLGKQTTENERERIEDEVREERKQEERERLEEAARKRRENPHARLTGRDTDRRTPRPDDEEDLDLEGKSPGKVKKSVKDRLFGRA